MRKFFPFLLVVLVPATLWSAGPVSYEIRNETFDFGSDGIPVEWKPYPEANGSGTKLEAGEKGGLMLTDIDEMSSVGVGQWIKVEGGYKYRATLTFEGEGTVFVDIVFTPRFPTKIGQMRQLKIHELKTKVEAGDSCVLEGVAPAEAAYAWVWIYSQAKSPDETRVLLKSLKIEDLGAAPTESVPPAVTPPPKGSKQAPATGEPAAAGS